MGGNKRIWERGQNRHLVSKSADSGSFVAGYINWPKEIMLLVNIELLTFFELAGVAEKRVTTNFLSLNLAGVCRCFMSIESKVEKK